MQGLVFFIVTYPIRFIFSLFTKPLEELYQPSERHLQLFEAANVLMQPYWREPSKSNKFNLFTQEQQAEFKLASEYYQQIINENGQSWPAYLNLAKSQRTFGFSIKALKNIQQAYSIKKEHAEIISEYVWVSLENHDISTAFTLLKYIKQSFPDNALLKRQIVYVFLLMNEIGHADKAIANYITQFSHINNGYDYTDFLIELNKIQHYSNQITATKIIPKMHISELLDEIAKQNSHLNL